MAEGNIYNNVFEGCTVLESVTVPYNIISFGNAVFKNCASLKSIYFEGDAPTLGTDVFKGVPSDMTIYYHADKSGWSNPWNGYKTATY